MKTKSLMPWSRSEKGVAPPDPFSALHEQMDDMLEKFFARARPDEPLAHFWPSVDVSETEGEVKVQAELPGLEEKDIDASINDDVLTLKGEKRHEKEQKGEESYCLERSYGSFRRDIPLPSRVLTDQAKATFSKGVLTITVPKAPEAGDAKN